jgi:eukaryotic translation initiation factor 2C
VIYDENKLPVDTLQQGTHTSSYSYARATKAVRFVPSPWLHLDPYSRPHSLIPPAYYADLACERGRLYLNDLLNLGDGDGASTAGSRVSRDEEKRRNADRAKLAWGNGVHKDIAETMFYI